MNDEYSNREIESKVAKLDWMEDVLATVRWRSDMHDILQNRCVK